MEFIDIKKQYSLHKSEIDYRIQKVLEHGNFIMGPEIDELEEILAEFVGVKHCITVSSGTVSLEIALRALNIGPGDEVITVPFSWISSTEVIGLVGARPVFVDIDPNTYTLDSTKLDAKITNRTKAIIAVSLFGQMPDLENIISIAEKYGITVIEDAAQSFGSTQNDKKSCGVSRISSTSFFPAKPLGCYGDGGALFTDDDFLAKDMKIIRSHGGAVRHNHTHLGMNGRFDTIQAAIILAKWPYFKNEIIQRQEIGKKYSKILSPYFITPVIAKGNTHVYGQYTIQVQSEKRNFIQSELKNHGIPTGIYYPKCLHEQPVFENLGYVFGDFPESEKASRQVLSLPMHPYLDDAEIDEICEQIIDIVV